MDLMTVTPHQPILILWDIDYTLVTIGEVSREIYEIAFSEIFGEPLGELADTAGRTEQAILDEILARHGVVNSEGKIDDFFAALTKAANRLRGRMYTVGRRLPGAKEAIIALVDYGVVQTVVTGSIKPVAATKLEVFHLAQYTGL